MHTSIALKILNFIHVTCEARPPVYPFLERPSLIFLSRYSSLSITSLYFKFKAWSPYLQTTKTSIVLLCLNRKLFQIELSSIIHVPVHENHKEEHIRFYLPRIRSPLLTCTLYWFNFYALLRCFNSHDIYKYIKLSSRTLLTFAQLPLVRIIF